jgi:cobalt/nickel transport system permease protein
MNTLPFLLKPQPLHIPDGMLGLAVSLVCWAVTIVILAVAIRRTRHELGERQLPLMGVMAAFIFAAQMINFPVAGGTSGHLLGGALAAIVLGPWAGMLVMTSVVSLQALLFQDGGLVVMGANILNMGLLTAALGYGLYRIVANSPTRVRLLVGGAAAWFSVMAAALATALQLWFSGTARLDIVGPAMLAIHALIGVGEALITVAALSFILRLRPHILHGEAGETKGSRGWIAVGALIVLGVLVLSPLAAADPDGLERVAMDLGFIETAQEAPYEILPDYTLPFLGETPLSTILAGLVGVVLVFGLTVLSVRLIRSRASQPDDGSAFGKA